VRHVKLATVWMAVCCSCKRVFRILTVIDAPPA